MRSKPLLLRLLLAAAGALLANGAEVNSSDLAADGREQQHGRVGEEGKFDPGERAKVMAGLESNLLSLLGFSKRPRPQRGQAHVPEPLKQLYRRQREAGVVDVAKRGINAGNANTVRTFVHVESEIDDKFKSAHSFRLSFDVSNVPESEKLRAAELILNRKSLPEEEENEVVPRFVRLMVHDIVRPGVKGKSKPFLRLVDIKVLDVRLNKSISLDVRPAVERWLSKDPEQSRNHGLLVQVVGDATKPSSPHHREAHVRLRRSLDEERESWQRLRPTLYTYTDDGRKKMSTASDIMEHQRLVQRRKSPRDNSETCRRHPFYLDFADIGWSDWIVAPSGYDAFFCHGDCPFPLADHFNSTNHAVVQNIVYSNLPGQAPMVCCVPTSLGAISILYLNEESNIVFQTYKDMSVLECGCR